MNARKKLCCLMSVILSLGILMPTGALEAVADQGSSSSSTIEVTSDSPDTTDGASSVIASGTNVDSDSSSTDGSTTTTSNEATSNSTGSSSSAIEATSDSADATDNASSSGATSTSDSSSASTSPSNSESTSNTDTNIDIKAFTVQQAALTVAASATSSGSEVTAEITGVSIERPIGTPVDEVAQGSPFYLVINWKVSDSNQILHAGDYFDLTLPTTLLFPSAYTDYEFNITDSNGTVVGTATITPGEDNAGGTAHIVFNSAIEGLYSVDGTIYIQAMANTSAITLDTPITVTVSTTNSSGSTSLQVDTVTLSDDEVIGKWGVRSTDNDGLVYWVVRINYGESTLSNTTISDELTGGDGSEVYVTDSFTLTRVDFSTAGGVTHTYETIDLSDKLTFSDDNRSFSIALGDAIGNSQYLLTYQTTYTAGTTQGNTVKLESTETTQTVTSAYVWQDSSGNVEGDLANRIKITKVDANDNTKTLAGAVFEVTAPDGSTFELTTGDDGTVTSNLLTQGTYKVKETTAPTGYELNDTEYTLEVTSSGGAILTVSDTPITTSVSVNKNWFGDPGESATFQLYADGVAYGDPVVLTDDMSWVYTWSDLYAYSDGEEITYTVEETDVPDGYDSSSVDNGDGTYTITNTQIIDISGTKIWDDNDNQDGLRPDSVNVNLLRDGTVIDTQTVTEADDGTWSFSFEDLPKCNTTDGSEYTYTVTEDTVTDYTAAITGDADSGFSITNTHEPETTSVSVTKIWDDSDNQDGMRPDSISVQLYADGVAYGDAIELSDENDWTYTWTDLDVYAAGEAIEYTIAETDIPDDYTSSITGDAASGFTITNTHEAASTSSWMPRTGDSFPFAPLILLTVSAAAAVAIAAVKRHSTHDA